MGIREVLEANETKDLLRLLTAGSVDDGKSTLIGRLLHDSKEIYEDHLQTLQRDSRRVGSAGAEIDYSLLVDGLKAEREQGITIDVAYRYFSTPRRKFIIADCPGHEQYTRNMATGASTADLALILIDARQGVLPQTRRHSFIASLLGIKHLVVLVNKMDLVDYSEEVYERIRNEYRAFAVKLEVGHLHFLPMSALKGDNVVERSTQMPWFHGAPLLEYLEELHVGSDRNLIDMRFPVQYVLRQDMSFRGYCGAVTSGILRPGDEIMVLPSGKKSKVERVTTFDGDVEEAFPPMGVTVQLADEIDVSRGDVFVHPGNVPRVERELEAVLVWMAEQPLKPRRPYLIKHTTNTVRAEISAVRYKFDINNLSRADADSLALNDIGRVHVALARPLAFDPYKTSRSTGAFIVIDPDTNGTVGAGMILDRRIALQDDARSQPARNLAQQQSRVTGDERAARLAQRSGTVWLTGLTGAGKSTIAHALERALFDEGVTVNVLDGENLRLGLSGDLGFTALERSESVRRAAHIARICNDAGLVTIVALVSPYEADRRAARDIIGAKRFVEVYLSAPLEVCERRDQSGLYERARAGEIDHLSGVDAPYEAPQDEAVDLVLPTHELSVDEAVARLRQVLSARNVGG